VLEGNVIGRCMQRHRHQEYIRFIITIEAEVPVGRIVHLILNNHGPHKHPKTRAWLDRHPRFVFHYTPASISLGPRRPSTPAGSPGAGAPTSATA
jgi:hypothetical protein